MLFEQIQSIQRQIGWNTPRQLLVKLPANKNCELKYDPEVTFEQLFEELVMLALIPYAFKHQPAKTTGQKTVTMAELERKNAKIKHVVFQNIAQIKIDFPYRDLERDRAGIYSESYNQKPPAVVSPKKESEPREISEPQSVQDQEQDEDLKQFRRLQQELEYQKKKIEEKKKNKQVNQVHSNPVQVGTDFPGQPMYPRALPQRSQYSYQYEWQQPQQLQNERGQQRYQRRQGQQFRQSPRQQQQQWQRSEPVAIQNNAGKQFDIYRQMVANGRQQESRNKKQQLQRKAQLQHAQRKQKQKRDSKKHLKYDQYYKKNW